LVADCLEEGGGTGRSTLFSSKSGTEQTLKIAVEGCIQTAQ
jgi:hypothetical protein